jgi:hypothetical protein
VLRSIFNRLMGYGAGAGQSDDEDGRDGRDGHELNNLGPDGRRRRISV